MRQCTQYLLYAILSMFAISTYGQNITGRIVDEKNMPMEFVNVVILSSDSTFITGITSHKDGDFTLLLPDNKNAKWIRFSFVGYADKFVSYKTRNVGIIALEPLAQTLQETVITAKRPIFRLTTGGIEIDITNNSLKTVGTANDVLSKLPNIEGTAGSFTVFGKGTAQIFLNGRQVYDMSVLDRLSSTEIQSVEVLNNPGSKYDNSVKAVIKIKTIKKVGDGLSGIVQGTFNQAYKSGYSGMVYLNYRKKGLDLFGNFYYNNNYMRQNQNGTQDIYHQSIQSSTLDILSHFQYISGTTGMNYEFNSNHSIGVTYTIDKRPGDARSSENMTVTQPYKEKEKFTYETESDFPSGINHTINSYYNGNVGKWSIDFNFDYVLQKNKNNLYTREYDSNLQIQKINTSNNANSRLLASKLILTYPVGKGKIDFGGEYTYTKHNNIFANEQEVLNATDDKIKESTASGFAEYGVLWKNWTLNAGIRYQATQTNYYERGVLIKEQSKDYSNLLPNISLGVQFNKVQTQLSYTAKKTRPTYYMLNSNVQYNNRFNYEGGNPLLQSATHHDITLSLVYSWFNVSASYLYKKNEIIRIDKPYGEEAILFTFNNFDKIEELNAQISISPKTKFWQPMYSISVSKQFLDAKKLQISEKLDRPIVRFKLNNSFNLPHSLILRADFYYVTKGNSETYLYKPYSNLSLSLTKSFYKNKLWVLLSATDILKGDYSKSIFYGSYMQSTRNNYSDARKVQLTLRYFFNMAKNKYKGTGAGADEKSRL